MAKHKETIVDLSQPYEKNEVGIKAILYFSVGLFFLVVITFGLMWYLQKVMEADAAETKKSNNPLALTKQEALPPAPRLQSAPGFGVESKKGFVNLELTAPQAEYRELQKQWDVLLKEGEKDEKTGTVISLPIAEAKNRLLSQNAAPGDMEKVNRSKMMVSDSSAGRTASVKVR